MRRSEKRSETSSERHHQTDGFYVNIKKKYDETNIKMQMNIIWLKFLTGWRQTNWLFTNMIEKLN